MTDITAPEGPAQRLWKRIDPAWGAAALILLALLILVPGDVPTHLGFAGNALLHTAPFILFAIFAVAYLKATGAETLLAKAFEGPQTRMIVLAALMGGLSPFCSCEVIPFVAALLALGAPLAAIMAFWLSSPLMDPAMFSITASALGVDFALAKTAAAVGLGILGGFGVRALAPTGLFADPLKPRTSTGGCCGASKPFSGTPVWRFWTESARTTTFRDQAVSNGTFLLKWLALAYLVEAVMIAYVPASWIANVLGGEGFQPILLGALVGGPAYLNGYAAVPLLDGLLSQGMAPGAAMSFVIAGGVSCIPAAIAVWALVKPRVFLAYLSFAFIGALIAGMIWSVLA